VLGLDIVKEKEAILRHVGYLPAEAMFYSGMRVKEILRFSAKLQKKDCTAEAQALCEALQLDRNKKIEELSLGNRKKVAIVCAMQHRPDLYLLDEPTSGLDPLMQRAFFELLRERHAQGATIFLSSHVLSEIQRHCNRAAIIRKGKIIACDDVEALSQTGAKRVTLHGVSDVPALAGIRDVQVTHEGVSFLYSGRIRQLIRALSEMPISDLTITEPDLEEIFLHYYEEGREHA
jgi:ABC-2 type transport system ATP-binding protein